jgi:hypothetical protein
MPFEGWQALFLRLPLDGIELGITGGFWVATGAKLAAGQLRELKLQFLHQRFEVEHRGFEGGVLLREERNIRGFHHHA